MDRPGAREMMRKTYARLFFYLSRGKSDATRMTFVEIGHRFPTGKESATCVFPESGGSPKNLKNRSPGRLTDPPKGIQIPKPWYEGIYNNPSSAIVSQTKQTKLFA